MRVPNLFLTDLYISEIECPSDKSHLEVFDSELRGFYVDVFPSGRKSFRLRYRFEKKLRVVTLGDVKFFTTEEARKMAIGLIRQSKQGVDPQAPAISDVGPLLKDFFVEKYLPYVKSYKRSWATDESMIRNHLVPKIGSLFMGRMTPPDIAVFLQRMKSEEYASGTCNRALVLLRFGFTLALRWKVHGIESNPVVEIKNIKDDNKIERYLTEQQTVKLLEAVRQSESEMLQYIVLFLIYTGARKREVEVDPENGTAV